MTHNTALRTGNRCQRANLIQRLGVNGFWRQLHGAATKIFPVGKTRVSANRDTIFYCFTHASLHGLRIACMKSTGNIGRGNQR